MFSYLVFIFFTRQKRMPLHFFSVFILIRQLYLVDHCSQYRTYCTLFLLYFSQYFIHLRKRPVFFFFISAFLHIFSLFFLFFVLISSAETALRSALQILFRFISLLNLSTLTFSTFSCLLLLQ